MTPPASAEAILGAPTASVIVCTYNRARMLPRVLAALARQRMEPGRLEVVVVDDGSSDDTARVCARTAETMSNLRYVGLGRNFGLGDAMNRGVAVARGRLLLFTDDDCIPAPDWATGLCAALAREDIVAGVVASPVYDYVKLCHNIAEFHPFLPGHRPGPVPFIAGASMGFRRSVVASLGGFCGAGEPTPDMEMILRARSAGFRIYRCPDAVVVHDPDRVSLPAVFRYAAAHAERTVVLRGQYRRLLKTPFVLASPLLTLLTAPAIATWVTFRIYTRNRRTAAHARTIPVVWALKLAWCWGAARGLSAGRAAARRPSRTQMEKQRCTDRP